MSKKCYSFNGGDKNLVLDISRGLSRTEVSLDGKQIMVFNSKSELKDGKNVTLDDGSRLVICMSGILFPEIWILHNGKDVEGTQGDPKYKVRSSGIMFLVLGGLGLILSLINLANSGSDASLFSGIFSVIVMTLGIICIVQQSIIALSIAVVLYMIDTVMVLLITPSIAAFIAIRVLFILFFIKTIFSVFSEKKDH